MGGSRFPHSAVQCRHHDHYESSYRTSSLYTGTFAHDNSVDMIMHQKTMSMDMVNMVKDVWFLGWSSSTTGAMDGACFVFLVLYVAESRIGCDPGCHGGPI